MKTIGAGVMFRTPEGEVLFLKRSDRHGEWAFPGGKIEAGETPQQAATREASEEIGRRPENLGEPIATTEIPNGRGLFAVFEAQCERFDPILNKEHLDFIWATPDKAPAPLHPGVAEMFEEMNKNAAGADANAASSEPFFDETKEKPHIPTELDVARAIASGDLPSPQMLANSALFDLRISGTGAAYRAGLKEYVWRDPSIYLNDEFLARCNGLPVVWRHPETRVLTSEEYGKRSIGTIIFPHIKGDEVWGVARIFDEGAIESLSSGSLSTSPAVDFGDPSQNQMLRLDEGEKAVVEGIPTLIDHLAVCKEGVWDKGGPPTGVRVDSQETFMEPDTEQKVDAAPTEAAPPADPMMAKLDAIMNGMGEMKTAHDAFCARMDALEGKNPMNENPIVAASAPVEPSRADESKEPKDEPKSEPKADARADAADVAEIKKQLAEVVEKNRELEARLTPRPAAEEDELASIQARADAVFEAHGERAPRPMDAETPIKYRCRLAGLLKRHSPAFKDFDFSEIKESKNIAGIEGVIYADAMRAANNPADLPEDRLIERTRVNPKTGQRITEFFGKNTFIMDMKAPSRRAVLNLKN